ncbi:MAG: EAL domain-containing protein [Chloroflexota bacterium]
MAESDREKRTILIADDEVANLRLLSLYLDNAGFNVLTAEDGLESVRLAKTDRPDLILLDIMMPDLNGIETCYQLKQDPETKDIPVIFMTALADTEDKVRGLEAGAVDYLIKPAQRAEILARVNTHLTIRDLQKNLIDRNLQLEVEIIERKQAEKQLYHQAFHDALTDLPNRTLFMNHLDDAIDRSQIDSNYLFAVLFLDVDRFKLVNDSLGHLVGDELLIAIARRLEKAIRPPDVVARLGGDEFAVFLDDIKTIEDAVIASERIQDALVQPVNLDGEELFTTVSIGITTSDQQYKRAIDVLRDADVAMYQAKVQGKAQYKLFDRSHRTKAMARLKLETGLWRAMMQDEFIIYYQPIVSLSHGSITGVEALLRWQHPQWGLISPTKFISLAEETGLILPIGKWLLQKACQQAQAWREAGHTGLRLAVNVSARQFQQRNWLDLVKEVLDNTGFSTNSLELEITESIVLKDDQASLAMLRKLRAFGVTIAIDDFGLGSSLEHLKLLPLDTLKIDQSFVRGMIGTDDDAAIIKAIITMAHTLKLTVVAEGVETEEQLDFLRMYQCNEVQGFLFSKPLPAEGITQLLENDQYLPPDEADYSLDPVVYARAARVKKNGYLLVNESLEIVSYNRLVRRWGAESPEDLTGQSLPDLFPELVGLEETLHRVARGDEDGLTISKIYRPSPDGLGYYFDMQFEPFNEINTTLLVMITDVTKQAHLEFQLRHERNELRLNLTKNDSIEGLFHTS